MAAAEFYNARPQTSNQNSFLSPPQPQRASSHTGFGNPQANLNYPQASSAPNSSPHHQPQYPPPPPYQPPLDSGKPTVHFSPAPTPPQQRNSFSHSQRPVQQTWNQSYPPRPQNLAPPGQYPNPGAYQPQYASYQTAAPQHFQPYHNPNDSELSLSSGHNSDPERHHKRRTSKDTGRERGHSTGRRRSRSTNTDGFIGAASGGLIGDLIFPGLGTVGGALAGWIGGKDYGNHRKWREQKREREQREWEDKYGSRDRHHDETRRSKSHERRRSHE